MFLSASCSLCRHVPHWLESPCASSCGTDRGCHFEGNDAATGVLAREFPLVLI